MFEIAVKNTEKNLFIRSARRMRGLFMGFVSVLVAICVLGMPATAQISLASEADAPPVRLSLIAAISATGKNAQLPLGLKAELDEGWKIYWRSPGDAGLPPIITPDDGMDYQLELEFPVPKRFSLFGIDSFGYADEVIFPLMLSGHLAGEPLDLRAMVEGLVCSDICIPFSSPVELYLPAGVPEATDDAQSLAKAGSLVPKRQTPILRLGWQEGPPAQLVLDATAIAGNLDGTLKDVFVETGLSGVSFGAPALVDDGYQMAVTGAELSSLSQNQITLTVVTSAGFAEFGAELHMAENTASQKKQGQISVLWMLMISFFGGLILNIMPCVLPVLMLKLNSIISAQTASSEVIRIRLLTGAAGILTSFLMLGCIFAILSVSGSQLGWGVQFQNLLFLSLMSVIITIFALSLFDRISLPIPGFAAQPVQARSPLFKDFISGFLATFLATPCSAPLVGTAISFAFTSAPITLIAVMMMMGLGLASPWLLCALFPAIVRHMPRPGSWMNRIKMLMGMGLAGTVIWLVWLVYLQAGNIASLVLLGLLFGVSASLYLRQPDTSMRKLFIAGLILCAVFAPSVITPYLSSAGSTRQIEAASAYTPFTKQRLAQALASDRIVFVDVTAEWCITCKVNKKLVLDSEPILTAFERYQPELIRADWTVANPEISEFLIQHERFGIPFNILFGSGGREVIILPELLSIDSVISALERLAKQN